MPFVSPDKKGVLRTNLFPTTLNIFRYTKLSSILAELLDSFIITVGRAVTE
jgi:hypothetical protein